MNKIMLNNKIFIIDNVLDKNELIFYILIIKQKLLNKIYKINIIKMIRNINIRQFKRN